MLTARLFRGVERVAEREVALASGVEVIRQIERVPLTMFAQMKRGAVMQVFAFVDRQPPQERRADLIVDEERAVAVRADPDQVATSRDVQRGDRFGERMRCEL